MTIPEINSALRSSLRSHRFSLRPEPDTRPGEEKVHLVLDDGTETFHAGWVGHRRGLWTAYAVVRPGGLFRTEEFGRYESFEDAVLDVLMSFTHVE
ncbi:hypothetical protein JGS22_001835 [Streptomyces sp. P38-E01]|uniref:Uncharacterized protein n=1 Tax=Streptomyces tardus TaxID=2780544 RepID=A0A949JBI1_9ACTN|nr:hypothetical protein [Streptomyces tardus]MBU7596412.1 hypothetical protein [Streptomyces tardus]